MIKIPEKQVSLKHLNTFGMDVYAKDFLSIDSKEALIEAITLLPNLLPTLILGGGSNILFTHDFQGLVIKNDIKGIDIISENNQDVLLEIGAGENWHDFVMYCVSHQFYGVENLSLIPGTVGAAPIQNIGAYGAELKDVFVSLNAIRLSDGTLCEFKKPDCHFGYRQSIFKNTHKNQFAIVSVTLKLSKTPNFNTEYYALKEALSKSTEPLSIKKISDTVTHIRQQKLPDPKKIGNAGSFFKNPEIHVELLNALKNKFEEIPHFQGENGIKIPAGWLIEQCGYKGKRIGDIGVHKDQALVLVNYGNGRGQDIANLAANITESVQTKFNITLEPEVNIL
jgi:UDP-N-acetylmuramate dehydrogenase